MNYNHGQKSGFEDIPEYAKPCRSPGHEPPSAMVIPYGKQYRHVCPDCGAVAILRNVEVTF